MAQSPLVFSAAAQALLAGHLVHYRLGVKLALRNETLYLAQGETFIDNTGQRWDGLGVLGALSGLECGAEAATAPLQMTLTGVIAADSPRASLFSALVDAVNGSTADMVGCTVTVYLLLFDATRGQAIDTPYVLQLYKIGQTSLQYSAKSVTLTVLCDPLFGGKHVPPLSLVTDPDQQAKYPGDTIFERVGSKRTVITYG